MASRVSQAVCLLAVLGCLALTARAEGLEVRHWFPDNPTSEFFPGKLTTSILGVRNAGDSAVNLTAAGGHLASPYNASINIYNFTTSFFNNQPLQPGEEASLEYRLFFPTNLPPRDFILKLFLFYSDSDTIVPAMVFNGTIDVIEEPGFIDTQLIGLFLTLAALAGLVGWLGSGYAKDKGWIRKPKKGKAKAGSSASLDKTEWLKGTAWDQANKKKEAKQS